PPRDRDGGPPRPRSRPRAGKDGPARVGPRAARRGSTSRPAARGWSPRFPLAGRSPCAQTGGGMTEPPRYACAWIPRFAAAALVRRDPDLRGRAVAVLTGTAATRSVAEVTTEAWTRGIRPGMSAAEARAWAPDLVVRDRDLATERAAAAALLDAAWAVSPRVEARAPDPICLDLAGLTHLYRAVTGSGDIHA